jgi:SAM-dependent methyltransferase
MAVDSRYHEILRAAHGLRQIDAAMWAAEGETATAFSAEMHDHCCALEDASFWFRHRSACILSAVRRFPPGGVVLDVGAGNGVVTAALRAAGHHALALEPGPEGAQNALRRGLAPVVRATLTQAGFDRGSVAAIGMFDVLEHLDDPSETLAQVAAALMPGGLLYLTVPAYPLLWSQEDVAAGHHRRYTVSTVAAALRDAGLEVAWASYFFAPLPLAIFARRTLPRLLGRPPRHAHDAANDHTTHPSFARRALELVLKAEVAALDAGKTIPFGASILAVARARAQA